MFGEVRVCVRKAMRRPFFMLMAVVALSPCTISTAALEPAEVTTMAGKAAPVIEGKALQDDALVRTDTARGKALVICFFASWCPPCQKELTCLEKLRPTIPADQLLIVGVALDPLVTEDTVPVVKPLMEKMGVKFPVVLATEGMVKAYECPGFPAAYLINPEGKFVKALYGFHPQEKLAAEVKALLPTKK